MGTIANQKSLIFIGNGFDVAHGRKTSYMDFYNRCEELKTLAQKGNSLCKHILDNIKGEQWKDLECGLHMYSIMLTNEVGEGNIQKAQLFESEFNTLKKALFYYLEKEQNRSIDKNYGHCVDLLFSEWEKTDFKIVSFNYTFCIANYTLPSARKYELNVDLRKINYQHGSINDFRGGYNVADCIVLGIDDSQLVEKAHSFLYKSHQKMNSWHSLIEQINESDIFIVYGCSMGPSDEFYYRSLFENKEGKKYIIYGKGEKSLAELRERVNWYTGGLDKFENFNDVFFINVDYPTALIKTKKIIDLIK